MHEKKRTENIVPTKNGFDMKHGVNARYLTREPLCGSNDDRLQIMPACMMPDLLASGDL